MERCRDRAHSTLAGCIAGGKIPVWGTRDDGSLSIVAPNWAAKRFDERGDQQVDDLYFAYKDFAELVRQVASEYSRRYLTENYGGGGGADLSSDVPSTSVHREADGREFEAVRPEWLELWQGPLKFRATYDRGEFGPGHTIEKMHEYADSAASGGGRHEPFYSVRIDPADGAIIVEWLNRREADGRTQAVRYYEGLGRGLYEKLQSDESFRAAYFSRFWIAPEQYKRAVGAFAIAITLQEWLRREFYNAIYAGQCEVWARAGSQIAAFRRVPPDIFRVYTINSWGYGQPGGAWAELEGAQSLYALHVAPVTGMPASVSASGKVSKPARRRGRTKGSGSLEAADAPLLAEMRELIDAGKAFSADGAAKLVAHKAKGGGVELSKATRLANRFRASEKN